MPTSVKGVCARHVNDVASFFRVSISLRTHVTVGVVFQGAHVTINARSEEDLDEKTILDKVAKASGKQYYILHNSCYYFHHK